MQYGINNNTRCTDNNYISKYRKPVHIKFKAYWITQNGIPFGLPGIQKCLILGLAITQVYMYIVISLSRHSY